MTSSVVPRHSLCVLGEWKSFDRVDDLLHRFGNGQFERETEYSQLVSDSRMERAFQSAADLVSPSMDGDDWAGICRHTAVAYILSPPLLADHAQAISVETLALIGLLFQEGAVAVKSESSGITHGQARWLGFEKTAKSADVRERSAALQRAWVCRPIGGDQLLYSCGMHLLGERDIEVPASVGAEPAIEWIDALGIYLLTEKPSREIKEREGFRLAEGGARREMSFVECTRYPDDDFYYNPYGYIRL